MAERTEKEVPNDEVKRNKKYLAELAKLVNATKNLLLIVDEEPDVWGMEEMEEVRTLSYKITGDPRKYPPSVSQEWGATSDELTVAIGERIKDMAAPVLQLESDVVLQITHADSAWRAAEVDGTTIRSRQWKFTAVDGDGTAIPLRVDSTLHTSANLLTPGSIVSITSFIPIRYNYEGREDVRYAIVVKEFEVTGYRKLSDEQLKPPTKRVKKEKRVASHSQRKKKANNCNSHERPCTCDGNMCSNYGVEFACCITTCIPVSSISLALVANNCVFATKEVSNMSQSEKRFLLYYYYATTVYQFRGAGNRVDLPQCLKESVRAAYPNYDE